MLSLQKSGTYLLSSQIPYSMLNSFHATGVFLYPLKKSENLWFSEYIQRVQKKNSGVKWVNW